MSRPVGMDIDTERDDQSFRNLSSISTRTSADVRSTQVERAVDLIERDLLNGALAPSARLRIHELCRRYRVGATPVREALSRLCALGLVQAVGQRGYRARALSRADLEDIVMNRLVVEVGAVRLSMALGGADWEAGVVAALHRLKTSTERDPGKVRDGDEELDRHHRAFHQALVAGCRSRRLAAQASALYDQADLYRRVMMRQVRRTSGFYEDHASLADRVLRRDVKAACDHLARHLHTILELVFPDGGRTARDRRSFRMAAGPLSIGRVKRWF
jgi:GntR family transcriptional regulator, carbon starvation induced regulator